MLPHFRSTDFRPYALACDSAEGDAVSPLIVYQGHCCLVAVSIIVYYQRIGPGRGSPLGALLHFQSWLLTVMLPLDRH